MNHKHAPSLNAANRTPVREMQSIICLLILLSVLFRPAVGGEIAFKPGNLYAVGTSRVQYFDETSNRRLLAEYAVSFQVWTADRSYFAIFTSGGASEAIRDDFGDTHDHWAKHDGEGFFVLRAKNSAVDGTARSIPVLPYLLDVQGRLQVPENLVHPERFPHYSTADEVQIELESGANIALVSVSNQMITSIAVDGTGDNSTRHRIKLTTFEGPPFGDIQIPRTMVSEAYSSQPEEGIPWITVQSDISSVDRLPASFDFDALVAQKTAGMTKLGPGEFFEPARLDVKRFVQLTNPDAGRSSERAIESNSTSTPKRFALRSYIVPTGVFIGAVCLLMSWFLRRK